ncbi:MAG: helix-turn-helix transcriptional regulator [Coriobacteriales bacterium]
MLCFLLVFLCFASASACWLAWFYHLLELAPGTSADTYSMVVGYLVQAAAIALVALVARKRPSITGRPVLVASLVLQMACTLPAVGGETVGASLVFGYAMSIFIGVVAAIYLDRLARFASPDRRGIVFGGGYACSAIVNWLLSLAPSSATAPVSLNVVLCVVLTVLAAVVALLLSDIPSAQRVIPSEVEGSPSAGGTLRLRASRSAQDDLGGAGGASVTLRLVALAAVTVFLMSLVKNLGSSFSSADIAAGVSIESSRMFYAAGLVIAGIVTDRSRKHGAICCTAALVTPFALLALAGEPLPGLILWSIDYFFFGFFAVFRVVLFSDMAARDGLLYLAGFGLLFGRIGDAAGTAVCQALAGSKTALVIAAAIALVATGFALVRLFSRLYGSTAQADPGPTEEELFEEFAASYELSARERDVLRQLVDGRTNAEIAADLFIAEGTVKFHVGNLLKKTESRNRTDLRAKYLLHRDEK